MPVDNLKEDIINYNRAYRDGNPLVSDEFYDTILEQLENEMGFVEFTEFRETLTEGTAVGAVTLKHDYVIGSLRKVKAEEEQLGPWLKKIIAQYYCLVEDGFDIGLLVQEKIDGMSFVAKYENDILVSVLTRGNGYSGEDITEKCRHILPNIISSRVPNIQIRGELTLTGESHLKFGYKNRRSGSVGIMKRDEIRPDELAHIKAIAYEILGSEKGRKYQLLDLRNLNFIIPNTTEIRNIENHTSSEVEFLLTEILRVWKTSSSYDMDGLVICPIKFCGENVFLPSDMVAFKVNNNILETVVDHVEWNVSKGGLIKPTVVFAPIDFGGHLVQRATGYNARYINDNKIKSGTKISVVLSGEVIPKIVKVIHND